MEEDAGDEGGEALAVGDESGYGSVVEEGCCEVVWGGGCLPEEDGGGCGDEGVVDYGGDAGGVLVG